MNPPLDQLLHSQPFLAEHRGPWPAPLHRERTAKTEAMKIAAKAETQASDRGRRVGGGGVSGALEENQVRNWGRLRIHFTSDSK